MSYLVLARKWRPQTFRDLIGQEHVSQTLKNAIDSGRVAHAFLFTGARGVGKTSSARILAKALNCEQGPTADPCNVCPACMEITAGTSVDVLEIDGASNTGVDDVRELRENSRYLPSRSRFKIFIVDEVHMLSTSAFNALLKTLEEPPAHVKFIFATTEPHKVPVTILSRCQRFDFKRIPLKKIVDRLRFIVDQENVAVSDAALAAVARKGDGSMRDSLSTLDQVLAFCGENVADEEVTTLLGVVDRQLLLETSVAVLGRDTGVCLRIVQRVDSFGYNMRQFCQELIDHYRNLVILKVADDPMELLDISEAELSALKDQGGAQLDDLQRSLSILLKAEAEMAHTSFPRLVLEMALIRMATLPPAVPVSELIDQLKRLEKTVPGSVQEGSAPVWDARPASVPAPPRPAASPSPAPASHPGSTAKPEIPAAPPPSPRRTGEGCRWEDFVTEVASKKVVFGPLLEHGRPVEFSAESVVIGFEDSFQLERAMEEDFQQVLCEVAKSCFGTSPRIRSIAITGSEAAVPPSLQEKKSAERHLSAEKTRQDAENHPLVTAAIEIFGGELSEVKKLN